MVGMLSDYFFGGGNDGDAGGILPPWLTDAIAAGGFQQGDSSMQPAPAPAPAYPPWLTDAYAAGGFQQGGSSMQPAPTTAYPPWLKDAVAAGGFQQGASSMQPAPAPATAYPPQPPEQTQATLGAVPQPTGGSIAREDGRERPYAPSALDNMPVPSLPELSLPPLSAIGDRLNAGLMGFAHGGAPLPAIANLISGLVTGQRADPQGVALAQQDRAQRAAAQYVAGAQDIEPNLRAAMIASPALAAQYLLARAKPRANPLAPRLRLR